MASDEAAFLSSDRLSNWALVSFLRPPLHFAAEEVGGPVTLAPDVHVRHIDDDYRHAGYLDRVLDAEHRRGKDRSYYGIFVESNEETHFLKQVNDDPALIRAVKATRSTYLALWIAGQVPLCPEFAVVVDLDDRDEKGHLRWRKLLPTGPMFSELVVDTYDANSIALTREIMPRIRSLKRGAVFNALSALWMAATQSSTEIATLLYWVSLEALFATTADNQPTARLVRRVSGFFKEELNAQDMNRNTVSDWYADRSNFAHGRNFYPGEPDTELKEFDRRRKRLLELVLATIVKIIKNDRLLGDFNSEVREATLEARFPHPAKSEVL
jgi:hypothetical protein